MMFLSYPDTSTDPPAGGELMRSRKKPDRIKKQIRSGFRFVDRDRDTGSVV